MNSRWPIRCAIILALGSVLQWTMPIAAEDNLYRRVEQRFPPSRLNLDSASGPLTDEGPRHPFVQPSKYWSSVSQIPQNVLPESSPPFSAGAPNQRSESTLFSPAQSNQFKTQAGVPATVASHPDLFGKSPTAAQPANFSNSPDPSSTSISPTTKTDRVPPASTTAIGTTQYRLAEQPQLGERYFYDSPVSDSRSMEIMPIATDFAPVPLPDQPYDSEQEKWLYQGKTLYANQRPLLELGRPWYQLGQLPEPLTLLGFHNPIVNQFLIFGDFRTAVAANRSAGNSSSLIAWELNLNANYQLTSTERFVFAASPFGRGDNTRFVLDDGVFFNRLNPNLNFGFFEGDLGAIVGGAVGKTLPFDLPIAVGFMPMLVQNGVWMDDAVVGVAATIPARNSRWLDISNMDFTFLWAFDEISSPAFEGDNDAAKMYAILSFIEALGGYFEFDYAYLEDRSARDRSYHNIGLAYTRRYGRWISNSVRVIANAGQSTAAGPNTADGLLLLLENSLITAHPATLVPYFNLFAGFDRPQSVARAGFADGILRNTGILFESDGMTGYPTLDGTANDTWGGAVGLNLIAPDFSQQLIVEAAMVQVMNDPHERNAIDSQYGLGVRYQIPISNSWIFRTDAMYGHLLSADDIYGARIELRKKF